MIEGVDPAIFSMSPQQATEALTAMSAGSNAAPPTAPGATANAPPIAPPTAADAKAQLNLLGADPAWSRALFAGDGAVNEQFRKLNAMVAAGDVVGDAIAGIEEPQQIFETTTGGQLPSRVVKAVISGMRDAGLSDGVIEQALRGDPVSATEYAATRSLQAARHSDPAWVKALLSGSWSENREHQLMSIILSSPIAEPQ